MQRPMCGVIIDQGTKIGRIMDWAKIFGRWAVVSLALIALSRPAAGANPDVNRVPDHSAYAYSYQTLITKYDEYFALDRDSALTLLKRIVAASTNDTELAESYYLIGSLYSFSPQSDSAIHYLNNAYQVSEKINYKQVRFRALNHLGMAYAIAQNNKEALNYFTLAYQGAEQMADTTMVSMVSNNLAIIYTRFELYETAIDWHNKSRQILEMKGIKDVEDSARMRSHLTNIGVLYHSLNMNEKAIDTWLEALNYTPDASIQLFINLSTGFRKTGRLDKALEYAVKANEFIINDLPITYNAHISALQAKMLVLKELGRYNEALQIAREAVDLCQEHQVYDELINNYNAIGNVFRQLNQIDSALTYYQLSYQLLGQTEQLDLKAETHKLLSEIHDSNGQSALALSYLKDYLILYDSIVQQDKQTASEKAKILINYRDMENQNQQLLLENQINNLRISQDRNLRIALMTSLVLVLIIIVYVIRVYLFKKNQAHKLQALATQKTQALQAEVHNKDVLNKQLQKEKEKAQESDRLKSAFLLNMSHEIRTPMNDIMGFSNLLLEPHITKEDSSEFVKIINRSGQRLLNTIHDLIEISRIDANLVQVNVQEVDVSALLKDLLEVYRPLCDEKGIALTATPEMLISPVIMITDKLKLSAIFKNLLKNAIKYTHHGTIIIGMCKTDKGFEFFIKDTGIGIAINRQQAIFDRFVQADIEDKDAREGSGLGLSIAKAYVEMLGGSIRVESELGKGATFFFILPANDPKDVASNAPAGSKAY